MEHSFTMYRKAYPKETLANLEPALLAAQCLPHEIIGAIQPLLERKGYRVLIADPSPFESGDLNLITITNESEAISPA